MTITDAALTELGRLAKAAQESTPSARLSRKNARGFEACANPVVVLAVLARLSAAEAERDRLREALVFYAEYEHWRVPKLNGDPTPSVCEWDAGLRARAALSGPAS